MKIKWISVTPDHILSSLIYARVFDSCLHVFSILNGLQLVAFAVSIELWLRCIFGRENFIKSILGFHVSLSLFLDWNICMFCSDADVIFNVQLQIFWCIGFDWRTIFNSHHPLSLSHLSFNTNILNFHNKIPFPFN